MNLQALALGNTIGGLAMRQQRNMILGIEMVMKEGLQRLQVLCIQLMILESVINLE